MLSDIEVKQSQDGGRSGPEAVSTTRRAKRLVCVNPWYRLSRAPGGTQCRRPARPFWPPVVSGGAGIDTASYADEAAAMAVDLAAGTARRRGGTLAGVANADCTSSELMMSSPAIGHAAKPVSSQATQRGEYRFWGRSSLWQPS